MLRSRSEFAIAAAKCVNVGVCANSHDSPLGTPHSASSGVKPEQPRPPPGAPRPPPPSPRRAGGHRAAQDGAV